MIKDNLDRINANIEKAREAASYDEDVKLLAVTKFRSNEEIKEVLDYGLNEFGENRVQELVEKAEACPPDLEWHLIGHLQTNKAKYLPGLVRLIHSVDSLDLAKKIDSEAAKKGVVMDVLAEVNVAGEESKFGFAPSEVVDFARNVAGLANVRLVGLMTVAPFVENPEDNRRHFKALAALLSEINGLGIEGVTLRELSMGMTGDYEVAVEEGATLVRVGTGIFGNR